MSQEQVASDTHGVEEVRSSLNVVSPGVPHTSSFVAPKARKGIKGIKGSKSLNSSKAPSGAMRGQTFSHSNSPTLPTCCLTLCYLIWIANPESYLKPGLPNRDDPRFTPLRCYDGNPPSHFLDDLENTFVPLPDLLVYPKDFNPSEALISTLLTPQRVEILRHFAQMVHLGEPHKANDRPELGIILSGPHGVGKSFMSYILACTAYVNGCILVYIPFAGVIRNEEACYRQFFEVILSYNAPLLASIRCQRDPTQTLLDLACQEPTEQAFDHLVEELQRATAVPVIFIMDEHNELYKGSLQHKHPDIFRDWTTSTRILNGARLLPILSGSAHSKFETRLQTSMQRWKISLKPMSWESTQQLMKPGGPFCLPDRLKGKDRENEFECFSINGGCPREMAKCIEYLRENPNHQLEDWRNFRAIDLEGEAKNFVSKLPSGDLVRYLSFISHFYNTVHPPNVPGAFFDAGLMYYDGFRYMPICQAAADALLELFKRDSTITLQQVLAADSTKKGQLLQDWLKRVLGSRHTLQPIHLCSNMRTPLELPGYKSLVGYPPSQHVLLSSPTLYVPEAANHPAWDFVLHVAPPTDEAPVHRVIFIQASTMPFKQHDIENKKTAKSDTPAADRTSKTLRSLAPAKEHSRDKTGGLVKDIVKDITGIECTTSNDGGILRVISLDQNVNVAVDFVYVTTSTAQKCKDDESKPPIVVGLQVVCDDQLKRMDPTYVAHHKSYSRSRKPRVPSL